MSLMTVAQVAEFLGVKDVRVERLERESLLIAADKDASGNPLFDQDAVEKAAFAEPNVTKFTDGLPIRKVICIKCTL